MLSQSLLSNPCLRRHTCLCYNISLPPASFPTRAFTAFFLYMMGCPTLSSLALCLTILTISVQAQQSYTCKSPTSCSDCPTPIRPSAILRSSRKSLRCISKLLQVRQTQQLRCSTHNIRFIARYVSDFLNTQIAAIHPPRCNFPLIGTGEGLVDLDANGTTQTERDRHYQYHRHDQRQLLSRLQRRLCRRELELHFRQQHSIETPVFTCNSLRRRRQLGAE